MSSAPALAAPAISPMEARVKAAYLFNFTKFVEWPARAFASPEAPLVIGLLGGDQIAFPIQEALQSKRTPDGRPIEVRTIAPGESVDQVHVLYVAGSQSNELGRLVQELSGRPILLVGESSGFAQRGGTINFVVVGDVVRFEVNLRRAERAGLKLSGRLASVATLVRDANPE